MLSKCVRVSLETFETLCALEMLETLDSTTRLDLTQFARRFWDL